MSDNPTISLDKEKKKFPVIKERDTEEGKQKLDCFIPSDLIYFEGHFDAHPILPGVVQIHWAEFYSQQAWEISGVFTHLEKVKFQQVIKPYQTVCLTLAFNPSSNKVHFNFTSNAGTHSSGYICFSKD